jgi:UDP-N-acetylmuramate--alanine ligase
MIDVRNIEGVCFVGIGGIGMSAIARWFIAGGFDVSGYDRTESAITKALAAEGCHITFTDDIFTLPAIYTELIVRDKVLVIYTPAIPAENTILSWFSDNGYTLYKRAEILGEISENTETLAVAGTHGKTTVSTMLAHIMKQSSLKSSSWREPFHSYGG